MVIDSHLFCVRVKDIWFEWTIDLDKLSRICLHNVSWVLRDATRFAAFNIPISFGCNCNALPYSKSDESYCPAAAWTSARRKYPWKKKKQKNHLKCSASATHRETERLRVNKWQSSLLCTVISFLILITSEKEVCTCFLKKWMNVTQKLRICHLFSFERIWNMILLENRNIPWPNPIYIELPFPRLHLRNTNYWFWEMPTIDCCTTRHRLASVWLQMNNVIWLHCICHCVCIRCPVAYGHPLFPVPRLSIRWLALDLPSIPSSLSNER